MALMQWSNSLSVGIPEMDSQHQKLVQLLNDFHQAMTDRSAKDKIGKTLDALIAYTQTHFREEETLLKNVGYAGFEAQRAAHNQFIDEVKKLKAKSQAGEVLVAGEVMKLMWGWLQNHIMKMDAQYGPVVKAKRTPAGKF
jgi:hemerythrin-like metal-binding protein